MAEIQLVVSMGECSSDSEEAETQSISNSLMARFKTVDKAAKENKKNKSQCQSPTPKIQKVIFLLRDTKDFENYYEPRVVSLGPIHHGKEKYQLGEKYKLLLTSEFVKDSGKDINALYMKIKQKIKKLRDCFEEEVIKKYDGDDEGLAWLLFVDGCAILQYIYCSTKDNFEDSYIEDDGVSFAQQDLFLLENQLPYCLLTLLMNLSNKKKDFETLIETFIKGKVIVGKWQKHPNTSVHQKHIHLLDFLRTSLLDSQRSKVAKAEKKQNWKFNFNVQELRAAGIFVQCSKNKNSSLSDISFTTPFGFLGYLSLPPIIVDDSTRSKFLNLIAYEMSRDFKNDHEITSYIYFLNSLIDDTDDIKILEKTGIIKNFLCNEADVASIFNDIGTDLVPNFKIYSDVKAQIQNRYDKSIRTWLVQTIYTCFHIRTWSTKLMAFTGAFIGLVLTSTQTWYAVNSPYDDLYKSLVLNLTGKR